MDSFEKAKRFLVDTFGMWWPDADEGRLRSAADAWRVFADAVGDVCQATSPKAGEIIHHNRGEAIDTFEVFWGRYHRAHLAGTARAGWLDDLEHASRGMAGALDEFADDVGEAKSKIETELEIHHAVIVDGIAKGHLGERRAVGPAGAVATELAEFAARMREAVSTGAARIEATTLRGVAFDGVESVRADLAVAQALRGRAGRPGGGPRNAVSRRNSRGDMGTRRSAAARTSTRSRIPAAPSARGDGVLSTGDQVYYGDHSTTIGYDSVTAINAKLVATWSGYHDVVIHGNDKGYFMPGCQNEAGSDFSAGEVHPAHVAEAVENNPNFDGRPVRLISCHSGYVAPGCTEVPAAQTLANGLGVPVQAPTDVVGVFPGLPAGQEPEVFNGGYWRTFLPVID